MKSYYFFNWKQRKIMCEYDNMRLSKNFNTSVEKLSLIMFSILLEN